MSTRRGWRSLRIVRSWLRQRLRKVTYLHLWSSSRRFWLTIKPRTRNSWRGLPSTKMGGTSWRRSTRSTRSRSRVRWRSLKLILSSCRRERTSWRTMQWHCEVRHKRRRRSVVSLRLIWPSSKHWSVCIKKAQSTRIWCRSSWRRRERRVMWWRRSWLRYRRSTKTARGTTSIWSRSMEKCKLSWTGLKGRVAGIATEMSRVPT